MWSYEATQNSCDKDLQGWRQDVEIPVVRALRPAVLLWARATNDDRRFMPSLKNLPLLRLLTKKESQSRRPQRLFALQPSGWRWSIYCPQTSTPLYMISLGHALCRTSYCFLKTHSTTTNINWVNLSANDLLDKAEAHYRALIISKRWDSVGHHGSSFEAQRTPNGSSNSGRGRRDRTPIVMPPWHRTAPADGKPHERTFETKIFKCY